MTENVVIWKGHKCPHCGKWTATPPPKPSENGRDVLKAIADGAADPAELAAEAIKVLDFEHTRWYA